LSFIKTSRRVRNRRDVPHPTNHTPILSIRFRSEVDMETDENGGLVGDEADHDPYAGMYQKKI